MRYSFLRCSFLFAFFSTSITVGKRIAAYRLLSNEPILECRRYLVAQRSSAQRGGTKMMEKVYK